MILLNQMVVLFIIMLIGYLCRKIGLLNDVAITSICALVVNVANPALILSSCINQDSAMSGSSLLFVVGVAAAIYLGLAVCAFVIPILLRIDRSQRGVYQCMTLFSNIGFMGFPLVQATYGSDAMLMASLFMPFYNILIYTYGISVLSAKKAENTGETAGTPDGQASSRPSFKQTLKKVLNIGVVSCIIGMFFYLTGIRVPSAIEDVVSNLSSLTAPLSMIVIGDSMAKMHFKDLIGDKKLLLFSAIKLLVIPVIGIFLLKSAGISRDLLGVCLIMLATPVGTMNTMLAQQYGGDTELSSRGVAVTTVLSVATIPLVSLLL